MNQTLRPPAVPLLTVDPFLSVWSFHDALNGDVTRHWTGIANDMIGLVRIDGCAWRFLGLESEDRSLGVGELPAMEQTGLSVSATQTRYSFQAGGISLEVRFTAPLLLDDLMVLSRPVNYLTLTAVSLDGASHQVDVYLDLTGALCADRIEQAQIQGESTRLAGRSGVCLFNTAPDSKILASSGDNQRINWGRMHLLPLGSNASSLVSDANLRLSFARDGNLDPNAVLPRRRWSADRAPLVAAAAESLPVAAGLAQKAVFLLAYEDTYAIDYFGRPTPAYCFKDHDDFATVLELAATEYAALLTRCDAFDARLFADCEKAGGRKYAEIAALAYRQAIASHKLIADENGDAIFLSKECFSNGCIGTVDVSYPSMPLFLLFCPELVRGMLRPIFRHAATPAWPYDFAPHDVGQYPLATGQVYGLINNVLELKYQMPVEECGNMLIMTAAACAADGNYKLAIEQLALLDQWAGYLLEFGQDPGEQLCTDDFAGHLNHNANLSIKAIVGLGAYAQILAAAGDQVKSSQIRAKAQSMAALWLQMAGAGQPSKLTFDRSGTWSMKYNLLFDRLLHLGLFPEKLYRDELASYLERQNRYGLPLDSRGTDTKADWIVWCAALSDDPDTIKGLIDPLYRFYDETGSRVPMADWYDTISGRNYYFRNRTVIGGIFAVLLSSQWRKDA